jgi:RNA polymerase sigma factor (sigma-70 family)
MAQPPHADRPDADLLWSTAKDPEAFGVFYDRYEDAVLAFFMRATGRAEMAVDLTAETFAAALSSVENFRPCLGSARGWLFGIARHNLADTWERGRVADRARRRLAMEPLALDDEAIEAINALGSGPGSSALELLELLPEDQRTAVRARVINERDYAELADELDCSESVIRQRVSRGLRTLRTRLAESS